MLRSLVKAKPGHALVIVAESQDINLNLATEEYLYEHSEVSTPTLFLWRNKPTIIFGKH